MDFNNICRLCLTKADPSSNQLQENIVNLLNNLGVPIRVDKIDEDEELPQIICNQCEKSIESIFTFINICKRSYTFLRTILLHEKKRKHESKVSDNRSCDNSIDCKQDIEETSIKQEAEGTTVDLSEIVKDHLNNYNNITDVKKCEAKSPKFACKKCNLLFKSRSILSKHYKQSLQCRPPNFKLYKCDQCSKEFMSLEIKALHENVHFGGTPYICPYCIKQFKFKTDLHKHISRHNSELGLVEKDTSCTGKTQLALECDKCKKVFASRSWFQRHKLRHEGKSAPRKDAGKLDKNVKPFLCSYCAMRFYVKANLDAHLRVHTGEKPYGCTHCDMHFKQKSVLARHSLSHLDVRPKPFECDICQKGFTTKSHMAIHRRLHTGERPYECHFCQKRFNYKTRFTVHLRTHTGESPFVCGICNNSYYDNGSLRKHQKKKCHFVQ